MLSTGVNTTVNTNSC